MQIGTTKQETSEQEQTMELLRPGSGKHLTGLPGSEWAFWQCVGLRGAGFPAQAVLRLAASKELLEAAGSLLRAEDAVEAATTRALDIISGSLDRLRKSGDCNNKTRNVPLAAALKKLKSGDVPESPLELEEPAVLDDLRKARSKMQAAQDVYKQVFAAFSEENSRVLRETAALPVFREAVTWQNRQAVHTALDPLLRTPVDGRPSTSRSRDYEALIASYLQRYCVKNDTIGFFGPVGWAEFVPSGMALTAQPGPSLLATRKVYFETWPIETLSKAIARDRSVFPWLVPILMPFIRIEGSILHHPVYGPMGISAEQATILRGCDGRSPAKSIAKTLLSEAGGLVRSETQFYKSLAELVSKGMVLWEFNIPVEAHPERTLREAIQRIADQALRDRALGMLDELELARESVAAAAGCPEKLNHALDKLEQTFTRLTGASSTRGHGKTYAGRTIVYEDCRRDVKVQLGPELLKSLAGPLELLLTSARWLTWEFAAIYRSKFKDLYKGLSSAGGPVDAALFFQRVTPFLFTDPGSLGRPVQREFQAKWARILKIGSADKPLRYSSEDLREEVSREFLAPRAGWAGARYHSPDIMIAASSPEAIQQGDYQLAMGELHVGGNTLAAGVFVNQHPSPEDMVRAVKEDLGGPKAVPLPPKDTLGLLARTSFGLMSPDDFRLEYGKDGLTNDRSKALPISSMIIEEEDGDLIARTRDRRLAFEIVELLSGLFFEMIADSFRIIGDRQHTPRISIDRLVIKRESWRFSPAQMAFARQKHPADRFLAVQKWARACGLPRFNFFKAPLEKKPVYLDLHSPVLVDIFCKMVRRTLDANLSDATVDITEMFPTAEQIWLADAAHQRYTSELRIVAVDMVR